MELIYYYFIFFFQKKKFITIHTLNTLFNWIFHHEDDCMWVYSNITNTWRNNNNMDIQKKFNAFTFLAAVLFILLPSSSSTASALNTEWTDWDGRQICYPSKYLQPKTEAEVVNIVKEASANNQQVKVVGSGHSFSSITLTSNDRPSAILLNLDNLNKVIEVSSKSVTVQSGIRVYELNSALLKRGYALENTGAIARQSVAGATQTGTHGTGKNLGSMSTQILQFKLLLANGTLISVNSNKNSDIFYAGRVGLGALGIMLETTLRIVPRFKLKRTAMPYSLKQLLVDLPMLYEKYERLQWYYTPFTDNATLLLRELVPIDTPIIPCWPKTLLEIRNLDSNITCIDWSFKALCHEADDKIKYTEMEYFVDLDQADTVVKQFMEYQLALKDTAGMKCHMEAHRCNLFTGLRYAQKDLNWMSPMYKRDIAVISNIVLGTSDVTGPPEIFQAFSRYGLENIATKYGGRPHWGKQNWANETVLRPVYPKFDDFLNMRMQLDPKNMFLNKYLKRVLGL